MRFPSEAWVAAVVAALNRHPDLPTALRGLGPDLAAVVEADPGLPRPFAVYGRQEGGRLAGVRVLPDPEDIWELSPAYVVRAPYRLWKAILRGEESDPIRAALAGRIKVQGDLQALVRRAGYQHVMQAALAAVPTEWADDGGRS